MQGEVYKRLIGRKGLPVRDTRGRKQDWLGQSSDQDLIAVKESGRKQNWIGKNFRPCCKSNRVLGNPTGSSGAKVAR